MLFKSDKLKEDSGILSMRTEKDLLKIDHFQNVGPAINLAQELQKDPDKGFSKNRGFRLIGIIPEIEILLHPEIKHGKGAKIFLKTDAGAAYRTVSKDSI